MMLLIAGLLPALWCMVGYSAPHGPAGESVAAGEELIGDPHFLRGVFILKPTPGVRVPCGVLQRPGAEVEPIWDMAQWSSRFSLVEAKTRALPEGGMEFSNEGRRVILAPPGAPEADVIIGVNGRKEYPDEPFSSKSPWSHLLLEQKFKSQPALVDQRSVRLQLKYRLLKDEGVRPKGWDPKLHADAAQLPAYIVVRDCNPASKGFRDFLWFGVLLYDSRWQAEPEMRTNVSAALDSGTGKFYYHPPAAFYTDRDPGDGQWAAIDRDVLPQMIQALETAWRRGFLKNSRNLADFRLTGFNIGWEMRAVRDSEMQLRDLSITALPKPRRVGSD